MEKINRANSTSAKQQREERPAKKAGEFLIGNDLRVTRLGFGAMRITGAGIWGEPADQAEAVRVLRRAVELRINFIDTADAYGPGVSEEIIATLVLEHQTRMDVLSSTRGVMRTDRRSPNVFLSSCIARG